MTSRAARILLALGASRRGNWGSPRMAICRCLAELPRLGFHVVEASDLYETEAVGPGREGRYVNAVAMGDTHLPPTALLRTLKAMERRAGKRSAMRWGPRALDVDILDYRGRVCGGSFLKLPHPQIQRRPFVLVPLVEIAPGWRHPVLGQTARQLLRRLPAQAAGKVLRRLSREQAEDK